MPQKKIKVSHTLYPETRRKANIMAADDERSRSDFIDRLIRQEWERRQQAEGEQK
jgi:hypothetical protein